MSKLLTEGKANTKLAKGEGGEYLTLGLFMSPGKENDLGVNLCPFASQSCLAACLNTAGRAGIFPVIALARKRKAIEFLTDRTTFIAKLEKEIANELKRASKQGKKLVVRLNGTTDIKWPRSIMLKFPDVQFYDYTKDFFKMSRYLRGELPSNYHLTFSYSGENVGQCQEVLANGGHVATVFSSKDFPETWLGYPVVSGEENDLRFLDQSGPVVIGLKAKGKARKKEIAGSFVIQIDKRLNSDDDDDKADKFSQAIDNAEFLLSER